MQDTPPRSSLRQELFRSSILPTLIMITLIGSICATALYYLEVSKAEETIDRTNRTIDIYIEDYFTEVIDTVNMLSEDKEARHAPALSPHAQQRILNEYRAIRTSNNNFVHVYSGYENGLMLINNYTPPHDYDPTIRPWYLTAVAHKPNVAVGKPYRDINTNKWRIATSKALQQSNGEYGGVVAIDISADQIGDHIAKFNEYETEFSFVVEQDNKIIMHPQKPLINSSFLQLPKGQKLHDQGLFSYENEDIKYLAYYRHIKATGWLVITVVEKREIIYPIILKVFFIVLLTLFIALFLGFSQSLSLSKRLSRPLLELSKSIKTTIAGDKLHEQYMYPNNEIGVMAREIGQLAESEIISKSKQLKESELQYQLLMNNSISEITSRKIIRDKNGTAIDYLFQNINTAYAQYMGLPLNKIIGFKFTEIKPNIPPPYLELCDKVVQSGEPCSFEFYSDEKNSYYFCNVFRTGEDCFATIFMDITERKAMEEVLQESKNTYKSIMQASPDSTVIADISTHIVNISDNTAEMFGYTKEELMGKSFMDLIIPEEHAISLINQEKLLIDNQVGPDQYTALRKDESTFVVDVNAALIRDAKGNPERIVIVSRDATQRNLAEQKIQDLLVQVGKERDVAEKNAQTDGLTGLYNRRYFDDTLRREFAQHKRAGSQISLMMLDVDFFKKYNDHYGHIQGDDCLQQIAYSLKSVVARDADVLARYGGEEFVVILPDTDQKGAEKLAERIIEAIDNLTLPHAKSDVEKFVTISLGIATASKPIFDSEIQLTQLADKALYQAKSNGRHRYQALVATL